jgi:hypothetical protein
MKVYAVMKEWTNSDGWGISSPRRVATYADMKKARQHIYEETKALTALDYGHADVSVGSGLIRWSIEEIEVIK